VETENLLPPPDDFEPSQPAPPRRLRRFFLVVSLLLVVAVATVGLLIVPAPAFHRERLPPGGPLAGRPASVAAAAAEQDARRLVTAVSGLHADIMGVGPWEALFTERQINAWLAVDLPRNHPELLTGGVTGPRVEFLPGRVRAAVRLGREPLAASIWIEAEVRLREVNQLGISLRAAGLGRLPLPSGPLLQELARRLDRIGLVTEIRRLDDQRLLLVYIPSTHEAGGLSHWLRRLGITAGELVVTGETRRGPLRPAAE
jgi:hypothetical protein